MISNKIYSWQNVDKGCSIEKRSFRLEQRRLEILNSLENIPFEDYDKALIEEWLCLTEERDRVFRDIHRNSLKRDLNKNLLIAFEAVKNSLRLSYTLQHEELSPNLHKALTACSRELNDYVNKAGLEPLQIIITKDVDENLPNSTNACDDSSVERPDIEIPLSGDIACSNVQATATDKAYESYLSKVIEWKVSPVQSEPDSQFIFETQSNATYESCFDSVLISSVKRKPPFNINRFSCLARDTAIPMPIDFHTPFVDQIKDILNTSFD